MTTALTNTDEQRLSICEKTIERGLGTFREVGNALMELRDLKLYRCSHETFADYCQERWGFTHGRARQLISAAKVQSDTTVSLSSERQARELARVPEDQRQEVLDLATEKADGKPLTASILKATAKEWLTPADEPEPRVYAEEDDEDEEDDAIECDSEPVDNHHDDWLAEASRGLWRATDKSDLIPDFLLGLAVMLSESESCIVGAKLENAAEALRSQ